MVGGWWVLDFTRLMLISTQVEVVAEVGVELGKISPIQKSLNCRKQTISGLKIYKVFSVLSSMKARKLKFVGCLEGI